MAILVAFVHDWKSDMEKALVMFADRFQQLDVIDFEDQKFIVFQWFWNEDQQRRRPELVLPLRKAVHQINDTDPRLPRYLVEGVFPANILDDNAQLVRRTIGIEKGPTISFPLETPQTKH